MDLDNADRELRALRKKQRAERLASMGDVDRALLEQKRQQRAEWSASLEGQQRQAERVQLRLELKRLQDAGLWDEAFEFAEMLRKRQVEWAESRRMPRARREAPPDIDGETRVSRQRAKRIAERLAVLPADRTCPICLKVILESRSWVVKDVVCCRTCYWELFNG